jgi:hypothetical protein
VIRVTWAGCPVVSNFERTARLRGSSRKLLVSESLCPQADSLR